MKGLKQLCEVSLQQPLTLRGTILYIIKFVLQIKYTSINIYNTYEFKTITAKSIKCMTEPTLVWGRMFNKSGLGLNNFIRTRILCGHLW